MPDLLESLGNAIRCWADDHPDPWCEEVLGLMAPDPIPWSGGSVRVETYALSGCRMTACVSIEFSARVPVDSEDPRLGCTQADLTGAQDIDLVFAGPLGSRGPLPAIISLSPAMCGVGWP